MHVSQHKWFYSMRVRACKNVHTVNTFTGNTFKFNTLNSWINIKYKTEVGKCELFISQIR